MRRGLSLVGIAKKKVNEDDKADKKADAADGNDDAKPSPVAIDNDEPSPASAPTPSKSNDELVSVHGDAPTPEAAGSA